MRRTNQVCAVLLLLASVAAAADRQILPAPRRPLGAASHWRVRPDVVTLKVREPRLALQPISPRELMTALGQPASGGGFAVAGTAGLAETTTMKIQRRLEGVWTLRVPLAESGAFSSDAVDVQAEVVGITGSAGRLAPSASGEPEIAVRAVALPPRLVSRQDDGVTYEGGVLLELDLSRIRTSGTYSGTLILTVNHF